MRVAMRVHAGWLNLTYSFDAARFVCVQKRPLGLLPLADDMVTMSKDDAYFMAHVAKLHSSNHRFVYDERAAGMLAGGGSGLMSPSAGRGGAGAAASAARSRSNSVEGGGPAAPVSASPTVGSSATSAASKPSPSALVPVPGVDPRMLFGVVHYAGLVTYNMSGWIDKNRDELMPNVVTMMQRAGNAFVARELFAEPAAATAPAGAPPAAAVAAAASGGSSSPAPGFRSPTAGLSAAAFGGAASGQRRLTQAGAFRQQLDHLMAVLDASTPHFVRCIKPNGRKQPLSVDAPLVLQQLRYSGVFEAVKIRQQGEWRACRCAAMSR